MTTNTLKTMLLLLCCIYASTIPADHDTENLLDYNSREFFTALCNEDKQAIIALIKQPNFSNNSNNPCTESLAHMAARCGHMYIIEALHEKGIDLNAQTITDKKQTPLMLALEYKHEELAVMMIGYGCKPNIEDVYGSTALHYASRRGLEKAVKALLSNGARTDIQDIYNTTALHYASYNGHQKVVRRLLNQGASIDIKDNYGSTALHYASSNGHQKIVQLLLNRGACMESTNNRSENAARLSCSDEIDGILSSAKTKRDRAKQATAQREQANTRKKSPLAQETK